MELSKMFENMDFAVFILNFIHEPHDKYKLSPGRAYLD